MTGRSVQAGTQMVHTTCPRIVNIASPWGPIDLGRSDQHGTSRRAPGLKVGRWGGVTSTGCSVAGMACTPRRQNEAASGPTG